MNHQMLQMPEEMMSNEKHAEIGKRFKSLSSKKFFVCLSISFFSGPLHHQCAWVKQ